MYFLRNKHFYFDENNLRWVRGAINFKKLKTGKAEMDGVIHFKKSRTTHAVRSNRWRCKNGDGGARVISV